MDRHPSGKWYSLCRQEGWRNHKGVGEAPWQLKYRAHVVECETWGSGKSKTIKWYINKQRTDDPMCISERTHIQKPGKRWNEGEEGRKEKSHALTLLLNHQQK